MRARAYVPNENGLLRPGMLMSVDLLSPDRSMPAIPEVALLEEGNETFVFIADGVAGPDGNGLKAKRIPITIGARREGFVEVLGGIPVGAPIIVEGLVRLRDGQAIRSVGPPPAANAPSAGSPVKEKGAR
jgi:membrane fusion protein (multidrug efflux system)